MFKALPDFCTGHMQKSSFILCRGFGAVVTEGRGFSGRLSLGRSGLSCLSAPSTWSQLAWGTQQVILHFGGNAVNSLTVKCHLQKLLMLDVTSRESSFPEGRGSSGT